MDMYLCKPFILSTFHDGAVKESLNHLWQNCDNVKEELGDVLFAAVAVGRQSGIDCEELLAETCDRYIQADSEREAGQ